jgi:opacity protein-like surface antigen
MRLKFVLAALFLAATSALPAIAQVVPSATRGGLPLEVGGAYSMYYTDWSGNISGPTVWVEWTHLPFIHGLGLEAEGRDLNYGRTGSTPTLRMDTAEGGAIYRWRHFHRFDPYIKFDGGIGSIDFPDPKIPYYTHDTRTVYAPGGGGEFRVFRNVWVRGDYEYQMWPDFIRGHTLDPTGFTIGAVYDLGHLHSR